MFYIFFALFLFAVSVGGHIIFCRRATKQRLHAGAYIMIAVLLLGVYVAGAYFVGKEGVLSPYSFWGLPFKITAGVIFVLLIPIYLSFYVMTQLMSPSKKILLTIAGRGDLSYKDILNCVQEEDFITTRLNDLCISGCVRQLGDRYVLSASGQKIALVLNMMQHILGRDIGG